MPRAQTPLDRLWSRKAEEFQLNSLERIKNTAEKWLGTISILTGVFGIVVFVRGPSDISVLAPSIRIIIVVCLAIAILSTFLSISFAAIAAQGVPTQIWVTGSILKRYSQLQTKRAVRLLNLSRLLVIPAFVFMALAIGTTWVSTWEMTASPSNYLVIYKDGTTACGELSSEFPGPLALQGSQGAVHILEDVLSIMSVANC